MYNVHIYRKKEQKIAYYSLSEQNRENIMNKLKSAKTELVYICGRREDREVNNDMKFLGTFTIRFTGTFVHAQNLHNFSSLFIHSHKQGERNKKRYDIILKIIMLKVFGIQG